MGMPSVAKECMACHLWMIAQKVLQFLCCALTNIDDSIGVDVDIFIHFLAINWADVQSSTYGDHA